MKIKVKLVQRVSLRTHFAVPENSTSLMFIEFFECFVGFNVLQLQKPLVPVVGASAP
jgi:hypothetical protein